MTTGKKRRSNVWVLPAFLASCRKFVVLICCFARYAGKELSFIFKRIFFCYYYIVISPADVSAFQSSNLASEKCNKHTHHIFDNSYPVTLSWNISYLELNLLRRDLIH